MTATDHATEREIAITRVYDAPRELVWKAWTEPERLARWWGPRGWSNPLETITMDVRPGGVFRVTSIRDDDGAQMTTDGVYRVVDKPERIEFAQGLGGGAVTFADLGDGRTEMVFHATMHLTEEGLRNARAGLGSAFDRLGELVS